MQTKKVKKLLRRVANANGVEIDSITGNDVVQMLGSNDMGYEVRIAAYRNNAGKIDRLIYSVNSGGRTSTFDDLYVSCEVDNGQKFVKSIGEDFSNLMVGPGNIQSFANAVDDLPGVADGDSSTFVSLYGGQYNAYA